MSKNARGHIAGLSLALVLIALILFSNAPVLEGARPYIARLKQVFPANPAAALGLFCVLHLAASLTCFPGGCTALNIFSGMIFGFVPGCVIVASVTLLSACLAYLAGGRVSQNWLRTQTQEKISNLKSKFAEHNFWILVNLRLSPIVPFGALNLVAGAMRIPFALFISSTAVGIFFDVVVLNGLGASLGGGAI